MLAWMARHPPVEHDIASSLHLNVGYGLAHGLLNALWLRPFPAGDALRGLGIELLLT
jgi:hypothetical protein